MIEILVYVWLIGAVYYFALFSSWGLPYIDNSFDMAVMIIFNVAISLIWFVYVPLYLRKENDVN